MTEVNGCGDAMVAAALLGWLRQSDLQQIVRFASTAAFSTGQHYGAFSTI
ncbi:hypothetical protein KAH55_01045 [bacterium]|nr:hypothetical protein [bacterium]